MKFCVFLFLYFLFLYKKRNFLGENKVYFRIVLLIIFMRDVDLSYFRDIENREEDF